MSKDYNLNEQWDALTSELAIKFADGESLTMDSIIYLIGVQELGKGAQEFSKDDKINLMHIAVCRILEPYAYYEYDYRDSDGWPHYKLLKPLPHLKPAEQTMLMKEAIIGYFATLL